MSVGLTDSRGANNCAARDHTTSTYARYSSQQSQKNLLATRLFWRSFFIMLIKTLIPGVGLLFKDSRLEWKDVFKNKRCTPKQPTVNLRSPIQGSAIQFQVNRDSKTVSGPTLSTNTAPPLTTAQLLQHFEDGCNTDTREFPKLEEELAGKKAIASLSDDEKQHVGFVLANLKIKLEEILRNKNAFEGKTVSAFPFFVTVDQNKLIVKLPTQNRTERVFDKEMKMNVDHGYVVISKSFEEIGELSLSQKELRHILAGYVLGNVGNGLTSLQHGEAPYTKGIGISFNI